MLHVGQIFHASIELQTADAQAEVEELVNDNPENLDHVELYLKAHGTSDK